MLQRIQKAGKNLILFPKPDEVGVLLDNLSCRGLHLQIGGIKTEEEAESMMRLIEAHSKDRQLKKINKQGEHISLLVFCDPIVR